MGCSLVVAGAIIILRIVAWPAAFAIAVWLLIGVARADDGLIEPTPEEYADIQKWIPISCCWSSGCCRKVHESALVGLPKNQVRIVATGQVIPRTGWSQDKNTWRCTCDQKDGRWVVHEKANTRCVFTHDSGY